LKTIIAYNEHEVKIDGSVDDLGNGYNVWIDLVDPDHEELLEFAHKFNLDAEAIETYFNKSKKPEIRLLDNHTFTVILDMKNRDPKTLETEGIYFFLGRKWLITIHSSEVKLKDLVERLFKVKNKKIKEAPIAALYYNVIAEIVTKYEQLLTALELSVNEYQRRSFVRPSPEIFDNIDILSRQTIILLKQTKGLSKKQYYFRMRQLLKVGVVQRNKGRFSLTCLGAVVYHAQLVIEDGVNNYWKLKAIDSIQSSGQIAEQERLKIIKTILDDNTIQNILVVQR
jgi:Mg2+ and Co2+ transporter CorA